MFLYSAKFLYSGKFPYSGKFLYCVCLELGAWFSVFRILCLELSAWNSSFRILCLELCAWNSMLEILCLEHCAWNSVLDICTWNTALCIWDSAPGTLPLELCTFALGTQYLGLCPYKYCAYTLHFCTLNSALWTLQLRFSLWDSAFGNTVFDHRVTRGQTSSGVKPFLAYKSKTTYPIWTNLTFLNRTDQTTSE